MEFGCFFLEKLLAHTTYFSEMSLILEEPNTLYSIDLLEVDKGIQFAS